MTKQLTEKEMNFLNELRWKMDGIKDDLQRAIFLYICFQFQEYKQGRRATKNVTKEQLLKFLIKKGLLRERADGSLPDDRKVREAARELLKRGLPIMTTARKKGYFVAENVDEIDRPQRENKSRATALLAIDKGYDSARAFLMGQGRIFG